ncbi:uncharacterized protein LOC105278894 isoform X2 [Ooceraea biroi]|uniref:uncharacterized protein LOC105278894 isoform X2 n=1 Tax=Ooceraea biroi TaxID=2015173 RepID=UPI000F08DAB1|nr:uncharacterized protein LOC105278894 isoform X2 [Ooceraea biroi]
MARSLQSIKYFMDKVTCHVIPVQCSVTFQCSITFYNVLCTMKKMIGRAYCVPGYGSGKKYHRRFRKRMERRVQ